MICLVVMAPFNDIAQSVSASQRPVDIFSQWNQIRNSSVSNDGNWFAYWETQTRGGIRTTLGVIRRTTNQKELRFSLAMSASADAFGLAPISFSSDSNWAAFKKQVVASPDNALSHKQQDASSILLVYLLTDT